MSEHDSTCALTALPRLNEHHLSRFHSKYVIKPNGCWEWAGRLNASGYGIFVIGHAKAFLAHRISHEQFIGPIAEGLRVCHRCDNPRCVNPEHLFADTQAANIRDMMQKGRHVVVPRHGEKNPAAVLTDAQAIEIKSRYVPRKVTLKMLADEFGVSQSLVSMIVNGKRRREAHR